MRGHGKFVLIAPLIVVSAPLGLVAVLLIIIILCHLGGAGLVPQRFKLRFRVLVTKADSVLVFFLGPGNDVKSLHRFFCFHYWTLCPGACLTAGGGPYRNFGPCDCFHFYFYLDSNPYCNAEHLA